MAKVRSGTILSDDGLHEDTIWTCEQQDSEHFFLKRWDTPEVIAKFGPALENIEVALLEEGTCPKCIDY